MEKKYERIISVSQSRYKAFIERKETTQQGSYNLPVDMEAYLQGIGALKIVLTQGAYVYYEVDGSYSIELKSNILAIIGKQYDVSSNKAIFVHTEDKIGKSPKFQMKRVDFDKKGIDYKWFVDLYDKNIEGLNFVVYVDDVEKSIKFDVELTNDFINGAIMANANPIDNEQQFKEWFSKQKTSHGSYPTQPCINQNTKALKEVLKKLPLPNYYKISSIFEIDDIGLLEEVVDIIKTNPDYGKENTASYGFISSSLVWYSKYLHWLASQKRNASILFAPKPIQNKFSYNRIIFGAPGTGKSYRTNEDKEKLIGANNETDYERVTFHPDYTYANFVGTYKPVPDYDKNGDKIITYKYVPGPFMRILVKALKNLNGIVDHTNNSNLNPTQKTLSPNVQEESNDFPNEEKKLPQKEEISESNDIVENKTVVRPFLLIIEEINRANVAAVFGDVFQLLDRKDGVSEYEIQTSEDMRNYLEEELGVRLETIKIPSNMYIWATMNSADQGVFPMDTAFKRRWDFTYLGIDENKEKFKLKTVYFKSNYSQVIDWEKLREAINAKLVELKVNEDKQLGPFFVSDDPDILKTDAEKKAFNEMFKSKIIMYLFEDAAKQKRSDLFEGCDEKTCRQYSKICEKFDEIGVGIFRFEEKDLEPNNVSVTSSAAYSNNGTNNGVNNDADDDADNNASDDVDSGGEMKPLNQEENDGTIPNDQTEISNETRNIES